VFLNCNNPLCSEGTYVSGGRCVSCPEGLTTTSPGAKSESECVEKPCPGNRWKPLDGICVDCSCDPGEEIVGCPSECPAQRYAQQPGRCFQMPCYYTPRMSIMMCPNSASEPCFWSASSTQTSIEATRSSTTYSASVSGEAQTTLKTAATQALMSDPELRGTVNAGVDHTETRVYMDIDVDTGNRVIGLRPGSQFCPEIREVTLSSDGHVDCSNFKAFEGPLDMGVTVGCDIRADSEHFNHGTWCPEEVGEVCFGAPDPTRPVDEGMGCVSIAFRTQLLTAVWVVLLAVHCQ